MNEIITVLCFFMLFISMISLFISLFGTVKAYRKYNRAKKELEKMKMNQETTMEEILSTQKEIIKIINSVENTDKDLVIEVLENAKKELEEKYQQTNNESV